MHTEGSALEKKIGIGASRISEPLPLSSPLDSKRSVGFSPCFML